MVMVDLLQKMYLVSNFLNIFKSFESSLFRTRFLFYPVKTLVHDIITCGRGVFPFAMLPRFGFLNSVQPCATSLSENAFFCFLRSMPEKVGQETNLKKLLKVLHLKESREKKKKSVLGLLFQMDNSLRKWKS